MSDQQPLGILLLEESLIHGPADLSPAPKRCRQMRPITADTECWIELAKYDEALIDN